MSKNISCVRPICPTGYSCEQPCQECVKCIGTVIYTIYPSDHPPFWHGSWAAKTVGINRNARMNVRQINIFCTLTAKQHCTYTIDWMETACRFFIIQAFKHRKMCCAFEIKEDKIIFLVFWLKRLNIAPFPCAVIWETSVTELNNLIWNLK